MSCEPLFLQAAMRRAEELGYRLSGYVRCLIAHDLTHHVVDPDVLARFCGETGRPMGGHDGTGVRRKAKAASGSRPPGTTDAKSQTAERKKGKVVMAAPLKSRARVRKRRPVSRIV